MLTKHNDFWCISMTNTETVLGMCALAKCKLKGLIVIDGMFHVNSSEHVLKEFSVSFNLTILPMCNWACGVPFYAKSLLKCGELVAVQFGAGIHLNLSGRTCPTHPVLVDHIDYVLGGFGWCGNGNMEVGTCINDVIELKGLTLGICPIHSVYIDSVIEIQHRLQTGRSLMFGRCTFGAHGTSQFQGSL